MSNSNGEHGSHRRRVAIVGGGVSGLAAAWHLKTNSPEGGDGVDVHLFEAADRLGGHAHTMTVHPAGEKGVDVDVGFMVYNNDNYPNMTPWFDELGVEGEDSDMSLSVSLDDGKTVEWSSSGLAGVFADKRQLFRPSYYSFLRDMGRFNSEAGRLLLLPEDDPRRQVTIGEYLRTEGYSDAFATHYLLPMMAALWSASLEDVLAFPADQLVGFMCNHKMLQTFDRPQYKTPAGRSAKYTEKMASILGANAHLSSPVTSVKKRAKTNGSTTIAYELFTNNGSSLGGFDDVVFACHTPQAVSILDGGDVADTDPALLDALRMVEYGDNVVYVHSDPALMPKRKAAWASWNCMGRSELLATHQSGGSKKGEAMEGGASGFGNKAGEDSKSELEGADGRMRAVYVTYYLNRLQNLDCDTDIFVSLNPHVAPDPKLVYKRQIMAHPQFSKGTTTGRKIVKDQFQGKDGLWFCGAWGGYGFHEDGCRSGFEVATAINDIPLPWARKEDAGAGQLMVLPPPELAKFTNENNSGWYSRLKQMLTYNLPVAICKRFVVSFLKAAITKGELQLRLADGSIMSFGDKTECGGDAGPVTARIFDDWFFVKVATEFDLGLARSYMSGHFLVEPMEKRELNNPTLCPAGSSDETNAVVGDPIGLIRLFLLFIGNRDEGTIGMKSARQHTYTNALQNASGLAISKIGSLVNYLRFKIFMDNSERGGSLKNIHAHYDLSNDLFTSFLDKETLMYSSAIYDAVKAPSTRSGLVFRGSLEDAQWRKLDTLLDRAQVQPGQTFLDIGFGWGGLSIHAAKKYGCKVHGITLSVEQKALAEDRVEKEGLGHLITFEVVDYRVFARRKENRGRFDRVVSCEMIEAVGHEHLGEFFWAVEQVLKYDGVFVMEAITTPEARYETYLRSTDFINTIIFPGGICPSLHALVDASYKNSTLTLEHTDNIGLHYAETLAEWRRRFNANEEDVRKLGFDDVFFRVWNYYFTYCEAGFRSQTENCLILVFSRPGNNSIVPLCESRSVTQMPTLTDAEVEGWLEDSS